MSLQHPTRHGFTAIELVTVLMVMAILSTMALPQVMEMMRASAVRDGANAIASCWNEARIRAMRTQALPGENEHFGVVVDQTGNRTWCGVIKADTATPELPDTVIGGTSGKRWLSRNAVVLAEGSGGSTINAPFSLVWYAQYNTGLPIRAADVAFGFGSSAPATAIGLGRSAPISSPYRLIRVMSLNFDPNTGEGHAYDVQVLPSGTAVIKEWNE